MCLGLTSSVGLPVVIYYYYYYCGQQTSGINKILTSCRRAAATICTRPSPPSVVAEALRSAEPTAAPADGNVAVGSHGEYFPRSPLQLPDV